MVSITIASAALQSPNNVQRFLAKKLKIKYQNLPLIKGDSGGLVLERLKPMLKADLHIHTQYSMDCSMPLEQIIERCLAREINCIAIADHGTVEGALKMRQLAPFKVIVAEEILTPYGEIMGMFLTETIPSNISVEEAVSRIKEQGGIVNIPHPFDRFRSSALNSRVLEQIRAQVDAVEVLNARITMKGDLVKAQNFARKNKLPATAGSDAHSPHEIGNAFVEMPDFNCSGDFLAALVKGAISGHRTNPLAHISSSLARVKSNFKKKLA